MKNNLIKVVKLLVVNKSTTFTSAIAKFVIHVRNCQMLQPQISKAGRHRPLIQTITQSWVNTQSISKTQKFHIMDRGPIPNPNVLQLLIQ
jgi:hypothetical protein